MDFDDFETIYALGLDEVMTGEREPDEEEQMLLAAIGSDATSFGGYEHSGWLQFWATIISLMGGK